MVRIPESVGRMTGRRRFFVHCCRHSVSSRAAEIAADAIRDATTKEPTLLLLSGGSSVLDACADLAQQQLPWSAVHVGQLDERAAPEGHPERAWPNIEKTLLARTGEEVAGRHPIPVDHFDAEHAAASYNETLAHLGKRIRRIIALCGLGSDGHVASLLPGDEKNEAHSHALATGPYNGLLRVTVSMPFLQSIPRIIVIASGRSKATAVGELWSVAPNIPAACLPEHTEFLVDREAATLMGQSSY